MHPGQAASSWQVPLQPEQTTNLQKAITQPQATPQMAENMWQSKITFANARPHPTGMIQPQTAGWPGWTSQNPSCNRTLEKPSAKDTVAVKDLYEKLTALQPYIAQCRYNEVSGAC